MAGALEVELARSRLTATIGEMTHLLYRSAYSTLMRESRDCSFMLLDPGGQVVVSGPGHFHNASYYYFTHALLERYGDMQDGDVYLTNHPYDAGIPHTPDLAVAMPVFADDVLIGFSCTLAHKADFGGAVVGSASMESTHIYQEGLLLPPLLAERGGQYNPVIDEIIAANVRNTDLFFGDMRAQIGTTRLGADRLRRLARQAGTQTLLEVYTELLGQQERLLRSHLAQWPDGTHAVEGFMDSDGIDTGTPVRLALEVTVAGDTITFDCTGTDDQTRGPVNMPRSYADTGIFYALVAMTDPRMGFNDGMRRAVRIKHRRGSVLDPVAPAPVGAATSVHHRFIDLCMEALSHFVPDRAAAHSGGSSGTLAISWQGQQAGARSLQYEVLGSAMGGMRHGDGASGVSVYCTNLAITPIEIIESQFPVRIRRFELVQDSAGAGTCRGGLSYRREYEALRPAGVIRRAERGRFPAAGVRGGRPGTTTRVSLDSGGQTHRLPVAGRYELKPGDVLRVEGPGGGGFGDPLDRPAALVGQDVALGHVSAAAARRDYGVVCGPGGEVDTGATEVLRQQARAERTDDVAS